LEEEEGLVGEKKGYVYLVFSKRSKVEFKASGNKAKAGGNKGKRKGPSVSAIDFNIGTVKKGEDGKMWVVKKAGKSRRWFRK
jgi:hypothetical protein